MEGTLNGGKKWASGTSVLSSTKSSFTYSGTTTSASYYYADIQLDFTPSLIVVAGYAIASEYLDVFNIMGQVYAKVNIKVASYGLSSFSQTTYSFKINDYVSLGDNIYRIPAIASNVTDITWYAYE